MIGLDLLAALPLLTLAAGTLVTLVVVSIWRGSRPASATAGGTLVVALASVPLAARATPRDVTPLLALDGLSLYFVVLVLGATLAVLLLSLRYLQERRLPEGEFQVLLLLAAAGAAALACSRHFAALFLGLETLSVALYGLVAYAREDRRSLEAGLKYLILAGASSAFLLFGVALVYSATGRLSFAALGSPTAFPALVLAGLGLVLVALAFKLALVPFHMWTPDVYEGAPAPVSALVASVSKGAVVAVVLRLSVAVGPSLTARMAPVLGLLAVGSILVGSLLALRQDDVKRLLAYSSITHMGYVLVALLARGDAALEAASFYVLAYVVSIVAAFGVVSALSTSEGEAHALGDYAGLFWRRPWLAATLTGSLLSLAGIPLTAGFIGKFYILSAGVGVSSWLAVGAVVVGSVLGLYYYLRVVAAMLQAPAGAAARRGPAALTASFALGVLLLLVVVLGVAPAPVQELVSLALVGAR